MSNNKFDSLCLLIILIIGMSLVNCATQNLLVGCERTTMNDVVSIHTSNNPSYIPHEHIEILSNSDFESEGFPGNGTKEDPYLISGYEIDYMYTCISIRDTDAHFIISDCFLTGGNSHSSIHLEDTTNGILRNNTMLDKDIATRLWNASHVIIENNYISGHNTYGVDFSEYSENNTLRNNVIIHNEHGIHFDDSNSITLLNNVISENDQYGIAIGYSENNTIVNNTIVRNANGLWLHSSTANNTVYQNAFAKNELSNAIDDGTGNHWNSTNAGNYWSDFSGTGVYLVSGSAAATDFFPGIPPDNNPPVLNSPSDMEHVWGLTGYSIVWNPVDRYPFNYTIYKNGLPYPTNSWYGQSISLDIYSALAIYSHNFTIVVSDANGNYAVDTVFITVLPQTTTNTTTTTTSSTTTSSTTTTGGTQDIGNQNLLYLGLGGLGLAVIIVIILVRQNR